MRVCACCVAVAGLASIAFDKAMGVLSEHIAAKLSNGNVPVHSVIPSTMHTKNVIGLIVGLDQSEFLSAAMLGASVHFPVITSAAVVS